MGPAYDAGGGDAALDAALRASRVAWDNQGGMDMSAAYEASLAEHQRLTGHSGGAFLPPTGQRKSSSRRRGRRR